MGGVIKMKRKKHEKEETPRLVTLSAPACAMSICKAAVTPLEAPVTAFATLSIIPQHIW